MSAKRFVFGGRRVRRVPTHKDVRERALNVLINHWDDRRGHTYPHTSTYAHQWLWDSCFAAICWDELGEHDKALTELGNVLSCQFPDGFVPHIRYASPNSQRGPRRDVSSFTQPPIYAHAARVLAERTPLPTDLVERIHHALEWLWSKRRTSDGLLFLVHPWESGADDSPRWDSWLAARHHLGNWRRVRWNRAQWTLFDRQLVKAAKFDEHGEAVASSVFECAPAAFNALASYAAFEYAELADDASWSERARELASIMDQSMWSEDTGLWSDVPVVGGGDSVRVPTLDGVLGALVTEDQHKAMRSLEQLVAEDRFAAPYGLAYVARRDRSYRPDDYWRGSAWMQMNYLARLAASRWKRNDICDAISKMSLDAVDRSQFAEHWNPETGEGRGAIPLTWSALVVKM